jgi:hypothetical protein
VRFHAPPASEVDPACRARPPLAEWVQAWPELFPDAQWPSLDALEQARRVAQRADAIARPRFVAQDRALLDDGLHYEQRIAAGVVATRAANWHDLLNALVWLRYPRIKRALNAAQLSGIAEVGPRDRTRRQCALTHFDEAGAIVLVADDDLLAQWDAHDWPGLMGVHADDWGERIAVRVFGHATLEHALADGQLLVAKAIALRAGAEQVRAFARGEAAATACIDARVAALVAAGDELIDPQDLRPLPLSGVPGWHPLSGDAAFLRNAPCFRPLRSGRRYPAPLQA